MTFNGDRDLTNIAMLGALGDPRSVHLIAVATAQAGGVSHASAAGIEAKLTELSSLDYPAIARMSGDSAVEAAAPRAYLGTLLGMRRHVDTTMLQLSTMSDAQMQQLQKYARSVLQSGGMITQKDKDGIVAAWMGAQTNMNGVRRIGEGLSVAGLGLKSFIGAVRESLRSSAIDEAAINRAFNRLGVPFKVLRNPSA
jgi:hypothetical protein